MNSLTCLSMMAGGEGGAAPRADRGLGGNGALAGHRCALLQQTPSLLLTPAFLDVFRIVTCTISSFLTQVICCVPVTMVSRLDTE